MTYEELIAEINAKINTNGVGEISGAVLNDVLKDIVDYASPKTVTVTISGTENAATFLWPFEDTPLNDLVFQGYNGTVITESNAYPLDNIGISAMYASSYSEYFGGAWYGGLDTLEKGKWYALRNLNAANANCMVIISKP